MKTLSAQVIIVEEVLKEEKVTHKENMMTLKKELNDVVIP